MQGTGRNGGPHTGFPGARLRCFLLYHARCRDGGISNWTGCVDTEPRRRNSRLTVFPFPRRYLLRSRTMSPLHFYPVHQPESQASPGTLQPPSLPTRASHHPARSIRVCFLLSGPPLLYARWPSWPAGTHTLPRLTDTPILR